MCVCMYVCLYECMHAYMCGVCGMGVYGGGEGVSMCVCDIWMTTYPIHTADLPKRVLEVG